MPGGGSAEVGVLENQIDLLPEKTRERARRSPQSA